MGQIDMIQARNLCIDPEIYLDSVGSGGSGIGIKAMLTELMDLFPRLRIGNFNVPKPEFMQTLRPAV